MCAIDDYKAGRRLLRRSYGEWQSKVGVQRDHDTARRENAIGILREADGDDYLSEGLRLVE